MGETPLEDSDIRIGFGDKAKDIVDVTGSDAFKGNCPLWTYILAEAVHHSELVKLPVKEDREVKTPKLGPVGGRIVAEVFLGLLFGDDQSLVRTDPDWKPAGARGYHLRDFVRFATGG